MSRRQVPKKPTFTFSNGVTVALERVGPMIALPIQRAHPPPSPPLAPGVGGQLEPNPADPDYADTLLAHQQKVNLLIQEAILDIGISDEIEIDPQAVARIRRVYAKQGITLDDEDRLVFIKYCCLINQADIEGVYEAIRNYDVTEESVAAAEATFQRNGDGATTHGSTQGVAEVQTALSGVDVG